MERKNRWMNTLDERVRIDGLKEPAQGASEEGGR